MASRKGSDSNVAHRAAISTMVTSAPFEEDLRMAFLISFGHMGNDLDGLAQVIAAPLLQNNLLVDAPGGVLLSRGAARGVKRS